MTALVGLLLSTPNPDPNLDLSPNPSPGPNPDPDPDPNPNPNQVGLLRAKTRDSMQLSILQLSRYVT